MNRAEALRALAAHVREDDLFISSLGAICDDWWNLRPGRVDNTFSPNVLGGVTPVALGLALALPHRRVFALETDGSVLMNLGTFCVIGAERPPNLTVVVFDNGQYECTGGHPTATSGRASLRGIALAAGCDDAVECEDVDAFTKEISRVLGTTAPAVVVARIEAGAYQWPPEERKWTDGIEDKYRFLRYIEGLEGRRFHSGARQK